MTYIIILGLTFIQGFLIHVGRPLFSITSHTANRRNRGCLGERTSQKTYRVNHGGLGERICPTTYRVGNTGPICVGARGVCS